MSSSYYAEDSRRTSFNYNASTSTASGDVRRPSLKEMPSFKDEASRALNRRDDLAKLKERLSFNRDILHADPSSKPWLRKPSVPIREGNDPVKNDAANAFAISTNYSLHTATPVVVEEPSMMPTARPRNLSRGTSASMDSSEGSYHGYDY